MNVYCNHYSCHCWSVGCGWRHWSNVNFKTANWLFWLIVKQSINNECTFKWDPKQKNTFTLFFIICINIVRRQGWILHSTILVPLLRSINASGKITSRLLIIKAIISHSSSLSPCVWLSLRISHFQPAILCIFPRLNVCKDTEEEVRWQNMYVCLRVCVGGRWL